VKDDQAWSMMDDFGVVKEHLGYIPVVDGSFSFRDFTPPDMVSSMKNSSEKTINIRYELYPFEYIIENGLISNTAKRRLSPVIVG